ncbi:MAG: hypothetical protein IPJ84_15225 [Bdellovibrionales bacterium]|nr:hypothetical protein [Bdellovibrionales bacterium]
MPNQTRDLEPMREVFKMLLKERNVDVEKAISDLENGFLIKTTTPSSSIVCIVYTFSETQAIYLNLEVAFAKGSKFELIKLKALIEETLSKCPIPFRPVIDGKHLVLQIRTPASWITDQMLGEAIDCLLHSSQEFMGAALERGLLVTSFFPSEQKTDLAETRTPN